MGLPQELRPLRAGDRALLESAVARWAPESDAYEHSWGYVLQATRDRGTVWYDADGSVVVFGRKPGYPHVLVVPTFFADPLHLSHAVRMAQKWAGAVRTVVKNVDPTDVDALGSFGFRPYRPDETWSSIARFDDQTFPQPVIELDDLLASSGRRYRALRKHVNTGNRCGYRMRAYRDADGPAVLALCATRDLGQPDTRFTDAHAVYIEHELPRTVVEQDGQLVGFAAWSSISRTSAAFCAGIFLRGPPALAVWGHFRVMRQLRAAGFRRVNLGGSEEVGVARFKELHFRPRSMLHRVHLVHR